MFKSSHWSRRNPSSRKKGGWTAVFEKDGRILYECGPDSLSGRSIVVGRSRECDWCTAGIDNTLSSRHAELRLRRGALFVRDLGSRNGLYCRGERIKEHRFSPGDTVLLGACKITVEAAKDPTREDAPEFHRLERLNGPGAGSVLELREESERGIEIGADPECAIHCPDTLVSRKHARLVVKKDGGCWIRDEGSRNGTTVNGVPLKKDKERMLRDGDVVGIAQLEFRFLEKGAVHVEARVGRKLLVAVATVAVAVMAFSLWNLSRTSARSILNRAEKTARQTWRTTTTNDAVFAEAFSLLAAAEQARDADVYAADIRKTLDKFVAWTNTICSWRTVRADLRRGKWKDARARFPIGPDSLWTFNSDEAPVAKHRAGETKSLLDAFWDVRAQAFATKSWDEDIPKAVADLSDWSSRLSEALVPFLSRSVEPWAEGIFSESTNIVLELHLELEELVAIENALTNLVWDPQKGIEPRADAARTTLKTIQRIQETNDRRKAMRREERVSFGGGKPGKRPIVFFSDVVSRCAEGVSRPIFDFVDAERIVSANVRNIAGTNWLAVTNNLNLPSGSMSRREFVDFQDWLEKKNTRLCGPVLDEWRGLLAALEERGFSADDGPRSESFSNLLSVDAAEILAFVPASAPSPDLSSTSGVCTFDRYFGALRTRTCLNLLVDGFVNKMKTGVTDAAVLQARYQQEMDRQRRFPVWRTVVQDVLDDLDRLRRVRDLPDSNDGLYGLVYKYGLDDDDAAPRSENVCRKWVESARKQIQDIEKWADDFSEKCNASEKKRDQILGDFALILLKPSAFDKAAGVDKAAEDLAKSFIALEKDIEKIDSDIKNNKRNALEGSLAIFQTAFPSTDEAYTAALEQVRRKEAGGNQ